MNLRERIGIDLGQKNRIEDGLQAAIEHGVRYLDLKIDVAPNAIETLTDERVANIRRICDENGIHVGIHTLSAVNIAEIAPHVRDGVDRYLFGHMDACKRLGGEWMVVHAGYHFTSDVPLRREAARDRLLRLSEHAEKIGLTLLLENMNWEPDDAEVHYLGHNLEECHYYFDRAAIAAAALGLHGQPRAPRAGRDRGFLAGMDLSRCDEVRLADCWGTARRSTCGRARANIDFPMVFRRLGELGFTGHYMNAFGTLQDMIEGREYLARCGEAPAKI